MSLRLSAAGVVLARTLGIGAAVAWTIVTAQRLGSDRATDVAFAALVVPGALMAAISIYFPPVFLSIFKNLEVRQGETEAWRFAGAAVRGAALAGGAATLLGMAVSPWLASVIGEGFPPDDVRRMSGFMQGAFLIVFFASVAAVLKGIVQARGSLVVPSLDSFVTNATASAVLLAGPPEKGAFLLVGGMVAGHGAKILLLAPGYFRRRRRGSGAWLHPGLKEAVGMLGPVLLGGLLAAAHAAVLRSFASRIGAEGAVSYLTYAERIVAAPIDVFALSLGTVLLPGLAAGAAAGDRDGMRRTVAKGLRLSVLLGLPAAVGLALVAEPLVALLLERGRFGGGDTAETARALRGYAPVLLFAGYTVLHQAFYALRRTGPILASGMVGVGVTIGVAAALSGPLGVAGLTLAVSAGTAASEAVLVGLLARAIGRPDLGGVFGCALRASLAAGGMAFVVWSWTPHVLLRVVAGGAVFAALAGVFCREELGWLLPRRRRAEGDQPE
ncbi:MAG TPA: lipid II flippase MurJ [Planctomycetota bacterium]|nr:lipid II flippase MurJ [Planctomycetota bacterium]